MRFSLAALATMAAVGASAPTASADDLIVRFAPDVPAQERTRALVAGSAVGAEELPLPGAFTVRTLPGVAAGTAVRLLEAQPGVLYAERDARRRAHAVPDDPLFASQWGHPAIGSPAAWDLTTGARQVLVAVVDGGVALDHPDLRPNLWTNAGEVPGNERDDDRNGFVDDVHGFDFRDRDATPADADGHGTHVSGILAAAGADGVGVAGVAWNVSLLPLRVLDSRGDGRVSDAIRAYAYAAKAGARVVNVSWGGSFESEAEADMIARHREMLFVASAGNEGHDVETRPEYPCSHDLANVVCVGASDRQDAPAPFTNTGAYTVDLAAPGVEIASTSLDGGWRERDGTSMAAPFVAGTAALMAARAPDAAATDLRRVLLQTAQRQPALEGAVATGGRLDAAAAVASVTGVASADSRAPGPPARPRVAVSRVGPQGSLRRLLRSGLRARVACSEACRIAVRLVERRSGHEVVLARTRGAGRLYDQPVALTVRLNGALRRQLGRRRALRATLRVRATGAHGEAATVSRPLTWRR